MFLCCLLSTPLKHREVSFGWAAGQILSVVQIRKKPFAITALTRPPGFLILSKLSTATCSRHKFKSISHDVTGLLRVHDYFLNLSGWLSKNSPLLLVCYAANSFFVTLHLITACVRWCRDIKMAARITRSSLKKGPWIWSCTEMMGVRGLNWK